MQFHGCICVLLATLSCLSALRSSLANFTTFFLSAFSLLFLHLCCSLVRLFSSTTTLPLFVNLPRKQCMQFLEVHEVCFWLALCCSFFPFFFSYHQRSPDVTCPSNLLFSISFVFVLLHILRSYAKAEL